MAGPGSGNELWRTLYCIVMPLEDTHCQSIPKNHTASMLPSPVLQLITSNSLHWNFSNLENSTIYAKHRINSISLGVWDFPFPAHSGVSLVWQLRLDYLELIQTLQSIALNQGPQPVPKAPWWCHGFTWNLLLRFITCQQEIVLRGDLWLISWKATAEISTSVKLMPRGWGDTLQDKWYIDPIHLDPWLLSRIMGLKTWGWK